MAMKLAFPTEHTGDRQSQQVQTTTQATTRAVNGLPLVNGYDAEGLVFTAMQTRDIAHKLGRNVRGYVLTRATNIPAFYEAGPGDDKTIPITFVYAGTYSLRFF